MAVSLADMYYLKALDEYPYNLEFAIENINYALSYDEEHGGANYLMGRLYSEQFNNFENAKEYLEKALSIEPDIPRYVEAYARILVEGGQLDQALKVIRYAYTLKNAILELFLCLEANIWERKKEYKRSEECFLKAKMECYSTDRYEYYDQELLRVRDKGSSQSRIRYELQ